MSAKGAGGAGKPPTVGRNLTHSGLDSVTWDPGDVPKSAMTVYGLLHENACRVIQWYFVAKDRSGGWSKALTKMTVLFMSIGALAPILAAAGVGNFIRLHTSYNLVLDFVQIGYVSLALAGTLKGFDKYVGVSTAYMRYITTALDLQRPRRRSSPLRARRLQCP